MRRGTVFHNQPDFADSRMAYDLTELIEALHDERVVNALEMALRDQRIRLRFRKLRTRMTVMEACEALAEVFLRNGAGNLLVR